MQVVHNKAKEEQEALRKQEQEKLGAPLSSDELIQKVSQIGTVIGREQAVLDNLRRKGFNV